jgi:hypothetical protein
VAAAALVVASWCWLGAAAVHVPEAYTLPGAVALLAFRLAWAVRRPPSPWQTAQVAIAWIFVVVPSLLWLPMAPDEAWIRLTALVVVALLTAVASSAIRLPWPVPGFAASGWQLIGELAAAFAVLAATLDAVAVGFHLRLEAPAIAYSALAVGAIAVGISALLRPIRPRQALLVEVAALPAALVALGFTAGAPFHTGLVFFLMGLVIGLTALRPDRRQAGFVAVGLELLATWSWLAAAHIGTPEAYTLPAAALAIAAGFWMSRRWPQLLSWATLAPGAAGLLLPSLAMTFVAPDESWRPFALGFVALAVTIASVYRRRQAPFLISATVLAILAVHELSPFVAEVVTALPRWVPLAVGGVILLVVGARYEHRRQDVVRLGKAVARMR